MVKEPKKGIVKKKGTETQLLAGSKITTVTDDGEVIEFILGSDICIKLNNDARLFPVK